MGLFDKLFSRTEKGKTQEQGTGQNIKSEEIIQAMLANGEMYLDIGQPEKAFQTYKSIVELVPDTTAQYNLGSLYAQGKGTEQDFLQAAYWFHQAEEHGESAAEKMRMKSTMDYLHEEFDNQTPYQLYQKMLQYAALLYPREDGNSIAANQLYSLAGLHLNKGDYTGAAKLLRAGAQFGNHGEAQNYLAVLYNAGAGLEKDDLAALYWFDRSADRGVEAAKKDRDGILNAYYNQSAPEEFYEIIETLIKACVNGTAQIPQDNEKAGYWRAQREQLLKAKNKEQESHQEKVPKTLEELVQIARDRLIEKEKGEGYRVAFSVPGTRNEARLYFGPVSKSKDTKWQYTVGVLREGTDMLVSHYLKSGTRETVYEYISTEEAQIQTLASVKELSHNIDERWS